VSRYLNKYTNCTYSDSLQSQFPKGFRCNENKMFSKTSKKKTSRPHICIIILKQLNKCTIGCKYSKNDKTRLNNHNTAVSIYFAF